MAEYSAEVAKLSAEAVASSEAAKMASAEAQGKLEEASRKLVSGVEAKAQLATQLENAEIIIADLQSGLYNASGELALERASQVKTQDQLAKLTKMYNGALQAEVGVCICCAFVICCTCMRCHE